MINNRILCVLLLFQTVVYSQIDMPPIFNNNMVLQQKEMVSIWGKDNPNTTITIIGSWNESATTKTNKNGKWKVKLKTLKLEGLIQYRLKEVTSLFLKMYL